jgi:hypothetical protein
VLIYHGKGAGARCTSSLVQALQSSLQGVEVGLQGEQVHVGAWRMGPDD